MASSVAAWVTSAGVWKTPSPSAGRSTPLFRVSFGWVASIVTLRSSWNQSTDVRTELPWRSVHVLQRCHDEVVGQLHAGRVDRAVAVRVLREVLLVVVLGVVERAGRRDLGRDLAVAGGGQARLIGVT